MPFAVDLFCGAGGMSEGLIRAGFDILFSNDISSEAGETYVARHTQLGYAQGTDTFFYLGDIHQVTGNFVWDTIKKLKRFENGGLPKTIDAIFGGPPCQGFSKAGRREKNDPRNFLFREYLRVISEIKPTYVVMENVMGFLDTKLTKYISGFDNESYKGNKCKAPYILKTELEKIGYLVLPKRVLFAEKFGVPQKRHRVIFIAYLKGHKRPRYPSPKRSKFVTLQEAIGDLSIFGASPSKYESDSKRGRTPNKFGKTIEVIDEKNTDVSNHNQVIAERFQLYRNGEDTKTLRERLKTNGIDLSPMPNLLSFCAKCLGKSLEETKATFRDDLPIDNKKMNVLLTKKNLRKKLDPNQPSMTVMTIPDDYISPFGNRTLSVRECARLQSFDDSFEFLGGRTTGGSRRKKEVPQYSQVGNAVPPLLSFAVAKSLARTINRDK